MTGSPITASSGNPVRTPGTERLAGAQFRLFADDGNLCVEGRIDSFAVTELPAYLDILPPKTGVLIDLSAAALASGAALNRLGRLADAGVAVTIRGDEAALDELVAAGLPASERLVLQPAPAAAALATESC